MRIARLTLCVAALSGLALAGCQKKDEAPPPVQTSEGTATPTPVTDPATPDQPKAYWRSASNEEGDSLRYTDAATNNTVVLACPTGSGKFYVNVTNFTPVSSEDRMSIGNGGIVTALVADPNRETNAGGMTGVAPVPTDLSKLLPGEAGLSVSYGNQKLGPLPPVPAEMAAIFEEGCYD